MPRPSPVSKTMGSLSPSLWMYSNVKSRKETDIDTVPTVIKKNDNKPFILTGMDWHLFQQQCIKVVQNQATQYIEQTARLNYIDNGTGYIKVWFNLNYIQNISFNLLNDISHLYPPCAWSSQSWTWCTATFRLGQKFVSLRFHHRKSHHPGSDGVYLYAEDERRFLWTSRSDMKSIACSEQQKQQHVKRGWD